jgi:nucleoid-associated protein YgaU
MADLEQLKQKYANVLELIKRSNVRLDHLHVEGDKLVMKGAAPNQDVKNEVWNAIKAVDPSFRDLSADISIDSTLPAPTLARVAAAVQTYSVKSGDTLSKIAKQFYGDAGQYMKIFEANTDQLKDPNQIQVGQELKIPA